MSFYLSTFGWLVCRQLPGGLMVNHVAFYVALSLWLALRCVADGLLSLVWQFLSLPQGPFYLVFQFRFILAVQIDTSMVAVCNEA